MVAAILRKIVGALGLASSRSVVPASTCERAPRCLPPLHPVAPLERPISKIVPASPPHKIHGATLHRHPTRLSKVGTSSTLRSPRADVASVAHKINNLCALKGLNILG